MCVGWQGCLCCRRVPAFIGFLLSGPTPSQGRGEGGKQAFSQRMLVIIAGPGEQVKGVVWQGWPGFQCAFDSLQVDAGRGLNANLYYQASQSLAPERHGNPLARCELKAVGNQVVKQAPQGAVQGDAGDSWPCHGICVS